MTMPPFERPATRGRLLLVQNASVLREIEVLLLRRAGYETVALCSCTDHKQPGRYHWPNDTASNVNFGTLERAITLSNELVRRLGERWL